MKPALTLADLLTLIRESALAFGQDKAPRLAAAIAYYAIFAVAPMLFFALAVASRFLANVDVQEQLFSFLSQNIGADAVDFVRTLIPTDDSLQKSSTAATIIGFVTLFLGATGLFVQLQDALNSLWGAEPGPPVGPLAIIGSRLLSFVLVLSFGVLIIAFLVGNTYLSAVAERIGDLIGAGAFFVRVGTFLLSLLLLTPVFASVYKLLPSVKLQWKDVWVGGAVTALMFTLGQLLIGLYFGRAAPGSVFGAAGSLVILLLWIYYSSMIFFFGAEVTWVYSQKYGTRAGGAANVAKKQQLAAQGAEIDAAPSTQELESAAQKAARPPRRVFGRPLPQLPQFLSKVVRPKPATPDVLPSISAAVWNAVLALLAIPAVIVLKLIGWRGGPRQ
ncbi:YihY/virulence factor BrkB family protein [Deinococcus puniceus]|uniref:Ribonuclease BN n=1 Tax=Deinococcus puniceus TaxID=1182568 RepID=A0A172TBG8_9DEIO|nr:YihY/virulence factor BrkB family protein [Deinococcus puniceus]ANE44379.1 ribonuclease BN [Deinococcus puniceus]